MRKKIMRITTDSRPMEEPKDPETDHLFQLYSLFVDDAKREEMAAIYRRGGFGYGMVKKELADGGRSVLLPRPASAAQQLAADPDQVQQILADGAAARCAAQSVAKCCSRRPAWQCGLLSTAEQSDAGPTVTLHADTSWSGRRSRVAKR